MHGVGLPLDPEFEQMALLMQPDDKAAGVLLDEHGTESYLNYDEEKRQTYTRPILNGNEFTPNEEIRIETHEVGNLDTPEQLDGDLLMVESQPKDTVVKVLLPEVVTQLPPPPPPPQPRVPINNSRRLGRQFGGHSDAHATSGDSIMSELESFDVSIRNWPAMVA